jgi:hypothetical protein
MRASCWGTGRYFLSDMRVLRDVVPLVGSLCFAVVADVSVCARRRVTSIQSLLKDDGGPWSSSVRASTSAESAQIGRGASYKRLVVPVKNGRGAIAIARCRAQMRSRAMVSVMPILPPAE